MMNFMTCRLPACVLIAVAVALTVGSGAAAAATFTWDAGGANNNWTTGSNWAGNIAPTAAISNDLIYSGSTRPGATGCDREFRDHISGE